ncbi:MAG: hypothetical protein WA728_20220, partial [Xanthobacteraceae bacterium]
MTVARLATRTGWMLGGGVEYAVAANLKLRPNTAMRTTAHTALPMAILPIWRSAPTSAYERKPQRLDSAIRSVDTRASAADQFLIVAPVQAGSGAWLEAALGVTPAAGFA